MQLATTEISVIGGGALLMIIVIVLWLFAHPKPLFMTTLSIFSGVLLGLSVTLLWFGEIHVMSLVMEVALSAYLLIMRFIISAIRIVLFRQLSVRRSDKIAPGVAARHVQFGYCLQLPVLPIYQYSTRWQSSRCSDYLALWRLFY
ncbi:hypothetical protein [Vibrio taketomensis]|uniref:hypothetical protein n=1 Tax=Vibrio taketomensis TaxID=2572923 RepID=UPI00138A1C98|nr:hypothetical protein [Vibrio taketomensis]